MNQLLGTIAAALNNAFLYLAVLNSCFLSGCDRPAIDGVPNGSAQPSKHDNNPGQVPPVTQEASNKDIPEHGAGAFGVNASEIGVLLERLVFERRFEELKLQLRKEQVRKSRSGRDVFLEVIDRDDYDAVVAFLAGGMDPNGVSSDDYTPIQFAVGTSDHRIIEMLCKFGADVNLTVGGRWPAIWTAIMIGDKKAVNILKRHGAKGNVREIERTLELLRAACAEFKNRPPISSEDSGQIGYLRPPMHFSSAADYRPIADLLKDPLVDVNASDPDGITALMCAANLGLIGTVQLLLEAGADVSIADEAGRSALYFAKTSQFRNRRIIELLSSQDK